jgi:hypothetical protein
MATLTDLDELALALPDTTKQVSVDGRVAYLVNGKSFCHHREERRDAIDAETGERIADALMFRTEDLEMKDVLLTTRPDVYFTTPHFDGYAAVLVRIPNLALLSRDDLGRSRRGGLAHEGAQAGRQGVAGGAGSGGIAWAAAASGGPPTGDYGIRTILPLVWRSASCSYASRTSLSA